MGNIGNIMIFTLYSSMIWMGSIVQSSVSLFLFSNYRLLFKLMSIKSLIIVKMLLESVFKFFVKIIFRVPLCTHVLKVVAVLQHSFTRFYVTLTHLL
jgi:hypothetical protein